MLLAVMAVLTAPQDGPVQTVASVDLNRYLGVWHEVARLPNRFEDHCVSDITATYSRREDGRLNVINRCRKQDGTYDVANGVARIVDASTNAKLKVRFAPAWLSILPFVWGDYWVIGLGDEYRYAVVGSPDRKYLWFLARAPVMDAADWDAASRVARANGYDLSRLIRTPAS
jgi:apolipoprotein D and lipocalin family protein